MPVGTVLYDAESDEQIVDLSSDGEQAVVAAGGEGGMGNAQFATPSDRAPRKFEEGKPGRNLTIRLELKLLADIGLVGFPNAGKSTLIARISAAKPKIADYPFTTLVPNLGIAEAGPGRTFVVADIPGLIEGASEGKGLGYDFLRHVERSAALCFVIDGTSATPEEDFATLLVELGSYNKEMLWKPRIVVVSKIDALIPGQREAIDDLRFDGRPALPISSVSGEGIDDLLDRLARIVESSERKK